MLTTSWFRIDDLETKAGEPLFYLSFRALRNVRLSEVLSLSSQITKAEAYGYYLDAMDVALEFTADGLSAEGPHFALMQNRPNPFINQAVIPFQLPENGWAQLTVFDAQGKALLVRNGTFDAGYNEWQLNRSDLSATGLLYYRVETENATATKRMLVVK